MTRMWCVPARQMCREHLLGEHKELHQLVGTVENHEYGSAIVAGHIAEGQVDMSRIEDRHAELVTEMQRRGMNHDSPLSYDGDVDGGEIDVEKNYTELLERCADCNARVAEVVA